MKQKIEKQFLYVASMAILATILLVSYVFYDMYRDQVEKDLSGYAYLLKDIDEADPINWNTFIFEDNELRITVVEKDGTVGYDNYVKDYHKMSNHADREEVKYAFQNGYGKAIRLSDTLSQNQYYYAVLLQSGEVLRVSKSAKSIWGVLFHLIPMIIVSMGILFLICILLAHLITHKLITPIEEMAEHITEPNIEPAYPELQPFLNTIRSQHEDILKNVNMRQEFTANVSHELKTPLTAISGYAELMENGLVTGEDVKKFSNSIHQNADRLLTLINDIIRLSELDSSTFINEMEEIDLYTEAKYCIDLLKMNAQKNDVSFELVGERHILKANKQMIQELIYNLCDNAIRYNNKGGHVIVSVYEEQGVVLSVKDNGIGISKEHQERIFERFYRVDKSRSKATGGTGLGLAIVKHIAMQHEAELVIESEPEKGTEIKVRFMND